MTTNKKFKTNNRFGMDLLNTILATQNQTRLP